MKSAVITTTNELKSFLGKPVGFIQVNESWIIRDSSYECAAWWEDREIKKGIYSLTLEQNTTVPRDLYLLAELKAVVVNDFFPALSNGVRLNNEPYKPQNIGEERSEFHFVDLVEAIEKTGVARQKLDVYLNPSMIDLVIDAARQSLIRYNDMLSEYWLQYRNNGDGKFQSNLSMVSHCAENMAALGRAIDVILRRKSYILETSDYMSENFLKNTDWINAA